MLTQTILLFIIIIDAGMSIFSRNNLSNLFINENYELKPLLMYCIRFTIMVAIIFINKHLLFYLRKPTTLG